MTYSQLFNQALELLDEQGAEEAYELVKQEWQNVENANEAQLYNLAYCFAALSGKTEEALGLMKEALYTKGYWYDYNYLMEEEEVEAGKPCLLVLHGDQQNAAQTAPYWQSAKELGYGLGLAQSSQVQMSEAYLWDDEETAAEEISDQWNALKEQGVDIENSILCGFSSGGRAAFYAAVSGAIAPKGLILVSPWLPELEEWTEDLSKLKAAGTAVYICCGDADEDCFEGSEALFEILDDNGIEVEFKLCPDLEHDYPENFEQILQEAIQFVKQ